MKFAPKIMAGMVVAMLLTGLGMTLTFWSFDQIATSAEDRRHVSGVIHSAGDVLSDLKDAETGQRGYLITGDEVFLQPYLAVRDDIPIRLTTLRQQVKLDAASQHLDKALPLINAKMAELAQVIEVRRHQKGTGVATQMVSNGNGRPLMDAIRTEMGRFIQQEDTLLTQREAEFESNMRHLFGLIAGASLLVLLTALSLVWVFYRQARLQLDAQRHLETRQLLDKQEALNLQLQQTNLSLQASEEQLAVTLNSIGDAVISTDANACVTRLNPLAEQLTGWPRTQAIGRQIGDILQIINKNTRQAVAIPVMDALLHGTVQGLANHTVLLARDGHEYDIADSCAPIRCHDGEVIGAVLVFRNVTAEYAVQQTARDSAALIQAILNAVMDGIITLHANGSIIETVNPAIETMFGYHSADILGQPLNLLIPEWVQFNGGQTAACEREVTGRKKDGSLFELEIAFNEMQLGGERHFTGIVRDVSMRKQAEEAGVKAGALQNAIFNSANFSSIATDAKGVIQIFNVGAERMLGYTAVEVMNKITPADISDPQEVVARAKSLSTELDTPITPGFEALVFKASRGIEDIYELTYIRKDGSRFPAVVSVTALRDDQEAIIGYLLIGTDNTARKEAEEALLKAGALQKAIFDSANFSSIATDAQGVIQIFNVGAERMLGYSAAEVMNRRTPADISDPQEIIARAKSLSTELDTSITPGFEALVFKASRGIEDIYELTYIRKDGSRFPAVVSVTALRDDQEAIIGYLLIGTDNTARKEAEEALLKAGALQNAIFNSANFSSIATDAKGVIQIFNVGAERMLGYTAVEVMNKITPADISDPQEVVARAKSLSTELDTPITPGFEALVFKASRGIEDIYELTYIRKDGSRFPAVVSVTALRDDQDAIIGYLLIGTDNTARMQIEEERKKLDQRLRDYQFYTRSLFECNIDAIMTTDPAGIITDSNKQMEALTGCTRDELIGAPFKKYFTDPDRAEAAINLALVEKKVTDYELTARTREGLETEVSYNATTFYDRDRILQGVFAAARDITERKRLDRVLEEKSIELESARALAEKANLAKSDFLSSMSHELRSPLNAILGFAQLMESELPAPTDGQQASISQILRAGWHLLKLINEILDMTKIESRLIPMSKEPVLLDEILQECKGMFEPQVQQLGIQMIFPPVGMGLFVLADRTRLKQVFINLLTNAIKYNTEHGSVEVICTPNAQDRIRVSIRDTGIGMNLTQQSQLFQAFNRLGQEAGSVEGTGIGLVVAKQLVELMGGIIGVESSVGTGSVFWFELPSVAAPEVGLESRIQALGLSAMPDVPSQVRTLLYVEDNPANMTLVEKIIERHASIRLLTAINGKIGIALAHEVLPDVILLDINLPGINGFEILRLLREDPATAHIPALAISANAMPSDIKKGKEAGFLRYLTKPIKVDEFMDALYAALELTDGGKP